MFEDQFGSKIFLTQFLSDDITHEYIGWLNDPEVVKYSNQRFLEHTFESSEKYLKSFEGTPNLFIAIKELSTKRMIGTMTAYISIHHQTVDIGIMLGNRSYWGQGIGLEAWTILLNWAKVSNYRKATAGAAAVNKSMINIMEKSGMQFEGLKVKQEIIGHSQIDLLFCGKFLNA